MAGMEPIIIQVKLVMSPEDQKLLGLLTALRKPENAITDVPVQVAISPEQELQIAQEAAKCLNSPDNREMTPELRREWEEWFEQRPQYLHLLKKQSVLETIPQWLKNLLESPGIERAWQFNPPYGHGNTPESIHLWTNEPGPRPRDMSYGYVETQAGRVHVHAQDWIVTKKSGDILVCSNSGIFRVPVDYMENKQ